MSVPSRPHRRVLPLLRAALPVAALLVPLQAQASPKAHIEPREIQLGEIQEGNKFERYVELTNVGDGVLVLEDVKTSCGCTAAATEGVVELKGGESQKIRVTFNSQNMEGNITKKVTITTNDPEVPNTEVLVKANVHKPVSWSPKYLTIDKVSYSDPLEKTIEVKADLDLDFRVLGAYVQAGTGIPGQEKEGVSEIFDLEVGDSRVEDDRTVVPFTIRKRPGATPQRVAETLVVATSIADRDTLRIPIRGEITGRINFAPTYAVLPMVEPGQSAYRDVFLTSAQGDFEVRGADVPNSPITVEVMPGEGANQTIVRLTYIGEEPGTKGVRQLRIETDDPVQSLIEIPVRYQTRDAKEPDVTPAALRKVQEDLAGKKAPEGKGD